MNIDVKESIDIGTIETGCENSKGLYTFESFGQSGNETDESYRRLKVVRETIKDFPSKIRDAGTHNMPKNLLLEYGRIISALNAIEQAELLIIESAE